MKQLGPLFAARKLVASTKQLQIAGLRMMPLLDAAYLGGAGTAVFPGFKISTFAARGTNVGLLSFLPWCTMVYLSDAFTNSTGWNTDGHSSIEFPSSQQIEAAWQPQVPAFVAYILYNRVRFKVQEFSHNEIRFTPDKDNFRGLVITDENMIGDSKFKVFHQEVAKRFDNDDLLFYGRGGHFSRVCPSGIVEKSYVELPQDVLQANTMVNQISSNILQQEYEKYMRSLALNFYNPLVQGDKIKELRVAREYGKGNPLFAEYYNDVMSQLDALHKVDPIKYPRIHLDEKPDHVEVGLRNVVVEEKKPDTALDPKSYSRAKSYEGREWTNSGGD